VWPLLTLWLAIVLLLAALVGFVFLNRGGNLPVALAFLAIPLALLWKLLYAGAAVASDLVFGRGRALYVCGDRLVFIGPAYMTIPLKDIGAVTLVPWRYGRSSGTNIVVSQGGRRHTILGRILSAEPAELTAAIRRAVGAASP